MRTVIVNLVVTALMLAACSKPANLSTSATLTVRGPTSGSASDLAAAQRIISARLDQFLPERDSSVTSSIEGDTIRFEFHGAPLDERTATVLATTPGVLRVSLANLPSDSWMTEADIVDVRLHRTEHGAAMKVQLTESAGRHMLEMTSKNIGGSVRISWNGKELMKATIQAPFGEYFQFDAPMPPDGLMMRVMLQHGRLPIPIESAVYRHGP